MPKAVLDTNVLISALIGSGKPRRLLSQAFTQPSAEERTT